MKVLRAIFRFYINASIHVALAVVALTIFNCLEYGISLNLGLLSFVFLSSITGYNFVKYAPIAKLFHRRLTNQLKLIQIFSFLAFIGLCVNVFFVNFQILLIGSALGTLTILYAVPIGRKNLREISILKVFVIALIWATTTFVFPFINNNHDILALSFSWYFSFAERFLWVVLLMIPFEIRDLRYDKIYLKTLISVFGIKNIKIISISILFLLIIQKLIFFNLNEINIYLFVYTTLALVIIFSRSKQSPYFASFWVESLPMFWALFFIFIEMLQTSIFESKNILDFDTLHLRVLYFYQKF